MQDKVEKLEQQKRKKEEDLKLKELEKLDVKFKRNNSSTKAKKLPNQITEKNDDPHKRLIDNILSVADTAPNLSLTNSVKTNSNIIQKGESKVALNTINKQNNDNSKLDKSDFDDVEFRKSKTKLEKIEINCTTNVKPSIDTNASKSNKAMDKLKSDLLNIELENSNILSQSLNGFDLDNSVNEDKYNLFFGNNLIDEYYEVYNFLETLNLHKKYFNDFIQHQFLDMKSIFLIKEKNLDEMKIKGGSKAKILNKIKEMKENARKLQEELYSKPLNGSLPECGVGTENEDIKKMMNKEKESDFYDEKEQSRLFQQAVMEFRNANKKPSDFTQKIENFNHKLEKENRERIVKEKEVLKKEKEKSLIPTLNVLTLYLKYFFRQ